jgi:phosphohistidine phosphatase SixA
MTSSRRPPDPPRAGPTTGSGRRPLLGAGLAALPLAALGAIAAGLGTGARAARAATADDPVPAALRAGGVAVLVRHARTEPGIGDPPGFDLATCRTQRNLSPQGRTQSQRIGAWFRERALVPDAVRSSRWCRCVDTAALAFGPANVQAWDALNSTFADRADASAAQTETLRAALAARARRPGFEVWVTHMVNIQALVGVSVAMGEAVVVRAGEGAGAPPRVVAQWSPGG